MSTERGRPGKGWEVSLGRGKMVEACWFCGHCPRTPGAGLWAIHSHAFAGASAKTQTLTFSEVTFFFLCAVLQNPLQLENYQPPKPFLTDKMFHSKTSLASCEQQNTVKNQLNVNPMTILCRLQGMPQSPHILMQESDFWVPYLGEASPSHTGLLRGCPDLHHCLGRMDVGLGRNHELLIIFIPCV